MEQRRVILLFLTGFLWIATAVDAGASKVRTFTNNDGVSIRASLESFDGEYVEIRREDGRMFTISLETLSQEDQEYVRDWVTAEALANDREVLISARRFDENDTTSDLGGYTVENRDGYYKVLIENRSGVECKDLEVRWVIRTERTGAGSVNDRKSEDWKYGKWTKIDLEDREELELETDRVLLREVSLKPGWKWTTNAPENARDKLDGIYLAIFSGGEMVREYSLPSGLLEDGRTAMRVLSEKRAPPGKK